MNAESILADMDARAERLAELRAELAKITTPEEIFAKHPNLKSAYERQPRIKIVTHRTRKDRSRTSR